LVYMWRDSKLCPHSVPPSLTLTVMQFHKVAPPFMWLTPSFERITHYIPYFTFPLT
jgi:hypothetical protein